MEEEHIFVMILLAQKAIKTKRLERTFETKITEEIFEQLREMIQKLEVGKQGNTSK